MRAVRLALAPAVLAALSLGTGAQELELRHELGQRLVRTERAYAAADADAREAALEPFLRAVGKFFEQDARGAARGLDQARRALLPAHVRAGLPPWTDALALLPEARIVEGSGPLRVYVERLYGEGAVDPAALCVGLRFGDGKTARFESVGREFVATLPINADGRAWDDELVLSLCEDGKDAVELVDVAISVVPGFEERLDAAWSAARLASAALDSRVDVRVDSALAVLEDLDELYAGTVFEVDVPAVQLLRQVEAWTAPFRETEFPWPGPRRVSAEQWLAIRQTNGALVRGRYLDAAGEGEGPDPPLLVVLHGAGASEHMVFDAFGAGAYVEAARRRGWSFFAPRIELGGAPVDVNDLVDRLAETYRFDAERVALVGHSMGAGLGIATVERAPDRWRALAALGGGRAAKDAADLDGVDVLAAGGERDFGLVGALSLTDSLATRKQQRSGRFTRAEVVAGAEHLTVVQAALPLVLELLDNALGGPDEGGSSGR